MTIPHISVLLKEILEVFAEVNLQFFIDGTLGAGGHSEALLQAHPEIQQLIGIDQDPAAIEYAKKRLAPWKDKLTIIPGNFSELENTHFQAVDGILLDLGVSSMQLDTPDRGFSFMQEGPLDMRMDPSAELSAYEIINEWSDEELGRIFREYGEEPRWRLAVKLISQARKESPLKTTTQLAQILRPLSNYSKRKHHGATLVFQALRLAVNDELGVLERILPKAIAMLRKGGRLAVISFHSLEDRIVKDCFRYAADDKFSTQGLSGLFIDKEPTVSLITKKPIIATQEEERMNPRSRSAKLRVIEKL